MSFASTCSLNLGLCLQSEELKHSQLLSSPGLTYSRCFWKPLLKRNIKDMQSRAAEQIYLWRWTPVPKDLMNSRVEGYEQIRAARSSGLLLMMYFAIYFMYLEGKLSPDQLCRRQQGRPGQWAQTVPSVSFISGKCDLLWEGVVCDTRSQQLSCNNPLWISVFFSFSCEKTGGVHNQVCSCPCWCWTRSTTALCEVPASAQLDFHYSGEVISLICFWQQDDFFFPASAIP